MMTAPLTLTLALEDAMSEENLRRFIENQFPLNSEIEYPTPFGTRTTVINDISIEDVELDEEELDEEELDEEEE